MSTAATPEVDHDPDSTFAAFDPRVKRLAVELAPVLSQLSEESQYHLEVGLGARKYDGVGGDLLVRFPRRIKEHPIVKWIGGGIVALGIILLTCVGIDTTSGVHSAPVRKVQAHVARVCRLDTGTPLPCVRRW